jgi:hypothetical protein
LSVAIVNVCEVFPAGILTLAKIGTALRLLLVSVAVIPFGGAAVFRVRVPVTLVPP